MPCPDCSPGHPRMGYWRERLAIVLAWLDTKEPDVVRVPTDRKPSTSPVVWVECQRGVLRPNSVLPALGADTRDLVSNTGLQVR
jgi:hypothetical protein